MKNRIMKRFSRIIILSILPMIGALILSSVVFIIQTKALKETTSDSGLNSVRFIIKPLEKILADPDAPGHPDWILAVIMEDEEIIYPVSETGQPEFVESEMLLTWLNKTVPSEISTIMFRKGELSGFCIIQNEKIPFPYRIFIRHEYLHLTIIIIFIMELMGFTMIFFMRRNYDNLLLSLERIKRMDFDTPINVSPKNQFYPVLSPLEDLRVELKRLRSQGVHFILSVSHDLKTPLTSMRMYLEALKDGVIPPEELTETIDKILAKADVQEERINELLKYGKGISQGWQHLNEEFELAPWIRNLDQYLKEDSRIRDRDFSSEIDIPEKPITIKGSIDSLSRAVGNLFENACRYCSREEPIRLTVFFAAEDGDIVIRMEDGGPGVEPEFRKQIFDLFFKTDHGRNTRGMGIGLASVKIIVEEHQGQVSCRESGLGGALFEIRLPVGKNS